MVERMREANFPLPLAPIINRCVARGAPHHIKQPRFLRSSSPSAGMRPALTIATTLVLSWPVSNGPVFWQMDC